MDGFDYSKHAVERFTERFPESVPVGVPAKVAMHRAFQGATLERGFMNDTRRLVHMLEKYGDFNFDYFLKENMVFVTRDGVVITVMNREDMGMQKMFGPTTQSRFRRKQKCPA